VPPDKVVEAFKASQAYGNNLKENGIFDCMYAFYEGGGFTVANADSNDEVYKHLLSYPMYSSFIWEVKPLLDWDKTFETGIGTLE
jgi:hypothetical protein